VVDANAALSGTGIECVLYTVVDANAALSGTAPSTDRHTHTHTHSHTQARAHTHTHTHTHTNAAVQSEADDRGKSQQRLRTVLEVANHTLTFRVRDLEK
jgi:hypothetical protein